MGIRGLKTFIERQDGLYERDYRLHDTTIVIDANNLIGTLLDLSQKHERRDLFGGDMVQFGRYVDGFFSNLKKCNLEPIFVIDGAQTHDENKSKTQEKHRRSVKRFQTVMSISRAGFGDFIMPAATTNVFRSLAVDHGLRIVQCMYEADSEIARISHNLKCPVISNDSDFFLMDLPHGVIGIDLLQHEQVRQFRDRGEVKYHYIQCDLFKQQYFVKYLPGLDIGNLPLIGVLAGNDFIGEKVLSQICDRLPSRFIQHQQPRPNVRLFRRTEHRNPQQDKILKILHYLSDKTLNETINKICELVPRERRVSLKKLIKSNLLVYDVPTEDDFIKELDRLYWRGFTIARRRELGDNVDQLRAHFEIVLEKLVDWLKQALEHSVLGYRCLELANRNPLFIQGNMDDPSLASAHYCQYRPMRVMLALLRSHYTEMNSCDVFDRIDNKYARQIIRPLDHLEKHGPLNYIFIDLPLLPPAVRRSILFATFHSSDKDFDRTVVGHYLWFESRHADELVTLRLLLNYVDIECPNAKLWKQFRQAAILCMLYHFYKNKKDNMLTDRLKELAATNAPTSSSSTQALKDPLIMRLETFIRRLNELTDVIERLKLNRMPRLVGKRKYNCRLMHQITQLQCSITSFNLLNAFLGDVSIRMRTEGWFNSCLIYNLAEGLRFKTIHLESIELVNDEYKLPQVHSL